jgi:hypothetical protein
MKITDHANAGQDVEQLNSHTAGKKVREWDYLGKLFNNCYKIIQTLIWSSHFPSKYLSKRKKKTVYNQDLYINNNSLVIIAPN